MTAAYDLQQWRVPEGARQLLLAPDELPPADVTRAYAPHEEKHWLLTPWCLFKPLGVIFWGATEKTFVTRFQVGNQCAGGMTSARLPAKYFETGRSFEMLKKLAAAGELQLGIAERQILDCPSCEVGGRLTFDTLGPFESFCFWGVTLSAGDQIRRVRVQQTVNDGEAGLCRGEVFDQTFTGEQKRFEVESVTEPGTIELLQSFIGKPRW